MRIIFFILILLISNNAKSELIKPNPNFLPKEVISIQLSALKENNNPYEDAGIAQTWEFAHPKNRMFTGPLSNFIQIMYSDSYASMINHLEHEIFPVTEKENISYFIVEILDNNGNKFGFYWTVEKVMLDGNFKNCWMTTSVSNPKYIGEVI